MIINDDELAMHHTGLKLININTSGHETTQKRLSNGKTDGHVCVLTGNEDLNLHATPSSFKESVFDGFAWDEISMRDADGLTGCSQGQQEAATDGVGLFPR